MEEIRLKIVWIYDVVSLPSHMDIFHEHTVSKKVHEKQEDSERNH